MYIVGLNILGSTIHFKTKERRYLGDIEILDEHVLSKSGCYKHVKRWLAGSHPELGVLHSGLTGIETIQEVDVIMVMETFTVSE